MKALITGSAGLVGSACAKYLRVNGFEVIGVDNGGRGRFFGESGVTWKPELLDICDRREIAAVVEDNKPDLIVHCAAQPSHDLAARIPFLDFETNAVGTLNLLEAARQHCPEAPFVFLSTNKVYGDLPNDLPLRQSKTRFDFLYHGGVDEETGTDQCTHSLFGCSKLAADVLVQEYGTYFSMPTVCLRAGCITGPQHAGVELHGFLSYLIKCNVEEREYKVYGYKGKQVRDNLHAEDVARFVLEFFKDPRCGEVYNIGGGYKNSCSILEAFEMAEARSGKPMKWTYIDQPRLGDHICYYSYMGKLRADYPKWSVTRDLPSIFDEMVAARMAA